MSNTIIRLSTPHDVVAAVPALLGFHPEDSLVIIGTGTGPIARLDFPHHVFDVEATRQTLKPAVAHWQHATVVVVGYTCDADTFDRIDWSELLPGVTVTYVMRVCDGTIFEPGDSVGVPVDDSDVAAGLPEPLADRETLVASTQATTDADEAIYLAWQAYFDGNGALAWAYLDRAVELGATEDHSLVARLRGAVDPRSE